MASPVINTTPEPIYLGRRLHAGSNYKQLTVMVNVTCRNTLYPERHPELGYLVTTTNRSPETVIRCRACDRMITLVRFTERDFTPDDLEAIPPKISGPSLVMSYPCGHTVTYERVKLEIGEMDYTFKTTKDYGHL